MDVATVAGFAASRLGVDPTAGLPVLDWLVLTGQSVLALIGSIEQWVSSVDFLSSPARRAPLRTAYVALAGLR